MSISSSVWKQNPSDYQNYAYHPYLSTIMPINHHAYQQLCLLTILSVDHHAYRKLWPLWSLPIDIWYFFATFQPCCDSISTSLYWIIFSHDSGLGTSSVSPFVCLFVYQVVSIAQYHLSISSFILLPLVVASYLVSLC